MKSFSIIILSVLLSLAFVTPTQAQLRKIKRDSYTYYMYGNQRIEKSEISQFLKNYCYDAYETYHNKYLKIGWGIGVPSFAMLVSGAVMSFTSGSSDAVVYTGIGFGAASAVGLLSSIVLLHIGYGERGRVCDVFNSHCGKNASATPILLDVKMDAHSLGLAISF